MASTSDFCLRELSHPWAPGRSPVGSASGEEREVGAATLPSHGLRAELGVAALRSRIRSRGSGSALRGPGSGLGDPGSGLRDAGSGLCTLLPNSGPSPLTLPLCQVHAGQNPGAGVQLRPDVPALPEG